MSERVDDSDDEKNKKERRRRRKKTRRGGDDDEGEAKTAGITMLTQIHVYCHHLSTFPV